MKNILQMEQDYLIETKDSPVIMNISIEDILDDPCTLSMQEVVNLQKDARLGDSEEMLLIKYDIHLYNSLIRKTQLPPNQITYCQSIWPRVISSPLIFGTVGEYYRHLISTHAFHVIDVMESLKKSLEK